MGHRILRLLPSLLLAAVVLAAAMLASVRLPAQPPQPSMHTPALGWAARGGQVQIAELLIGQGADLTAADHLGNTPLHLAVAHPEVVRLLLAKGAPVNARNVFGDTPLHLAVGNRPVVELLLAGGADANAINHFHKTPLEISLGNGTDPYNLSIIETLIRAGAKPQ